MARKWPDHFELERLEKKRELDNAHYTLDNFDRYFKPVHKRSTIDHVLNANINLFEFFAALKDKFNDHEDAGIQDKLALKQRKIEKFARNFINLCDSHLDNIPDHQISNLRRSIAAIQELGIPLMVSKRMSNRILLHKLSRA